TVEIDVHDMIDLGFCRVLDRAHQTVARVINQDIDGTSGEGHLDDLAHGVAVRDVEGQHGQLAVRGGQVRAPIAGGANHAVTTGDQLVGEFEAEPARNPGDEPGFGGCRHD